MGQSQSKTERCHDVYLSLTEQQAACLDAGKIKKKSGADVDMGHRTKPASGRRVIVRGRQTQIEAAVSLIHQQTGTQVNAALRQLSWLQWVEASFPDLYSRAYFLPPVYFNRVPMTSQSVVGQDVLVLQSAPGQTAQSSRPATTPSTAGQTCLPQPPRVQDSDVRDDAAIQRLLFCLQEMTKQEREVLVGMSNLQFGQYLGEPCYAAAAAQLPLPASLPPALSQNWKQGDFDVLLIHRHHGLVICEIKAFGDNTQTLNMSQQDVDNNIRQKVKDAVSQLDKAEAMLSHLSSDIAPGLRITKTLAFPNLTARQVQQAISSDTQLTQDLCRCLGTRDPVDISGLCLFSDQLSDSKTPWDVNQDVIENLREWWTRRVTVSGPDSHMTRHMYKILVSRFCGPATTVSVPCTCPPRVSVKTLGQAVWCTGECYTAVITLFPEQLHLLNTAPPTLFVTGPPGTGKTVVLLLMAIEWLRCGHHVYIVSTCDESRAACIMLYHLLLQTVNTQQSAGVSPGQLHLLQYHLDDGKHVEKAVNELSQAAREGSLYVVADEVGREYSDCYKINYFKTLCDKLLTQVPRLHLWAASCFHGDAPAGWQVEYLTRPLRSPPAVVREVEQDEYITVDHHVQPYSQRGVSVHTDGPPVTRLYHRGQGHSGRWSDDCVTCGREVATFLHSLRVGVTESGTTTVTSTSGGTAPACLQWRDVLVLNWRDVSDYPGMVKGLKQAGIPVQVMNKEDIEDVATARSDVVWVARGRRVRGLERKVVVCLYEPLVDLLRSGLFDGGRPEVREVASRSELLRMNDLRSTRLDLMSRCKEQLVIVSP